MTENEQIADIRARAEAMSDGHAAALADEFKHYCRHRNQLHENDARRGAAPLFPNIWTMPDTCAALVRRGEMTI